MEVHQAKAFLAVAKSYISDERLPDCGSPSPL